MGFSAVNGFGQSMTASFTVGQRVEMYLNLPANAFQTTLATYTGQKAEYGKEELRKYENSYNSSG